MIVLVKDKDGTKQEFKERTAERILRDAIMYKKKGVKYWSLPDDSEFKFSNGSLIMKAKKRLSPNVTTSESKPKKADTDNKQEGS